MVTQGSEPNGRPPRLDTSQLIVKVTQLLHLVRYQGVEHIPVEGPGILIMNHYSPMDLFRVEALMERVGRQSYRYVVAAELLSKDAFLPYVKSSFRDELPRVGRYLDWLAHILSHIVPPMFQRLQPIPVYRKGDDSESRELALEALCAGELLIVAPGKNTQRNSKGVREFTHGVASITRMYFEATGRPLLIVPLGVSPLPGMVPRVLLKVGAPFQGISNLAYPELFSGGGIDSQVKHRAYQHFTRQLELRVTELL